MEPGEALILVLTRKVGQSVMIGDDIQVTSLSDRNGQIKIGFDAPDDVLIRLIEVYEQIQKQE